jgi:hypothetical protein
VLAAPQFGLDLACGVRPLIIDALVSDFVIDVELGLADVDADVEQVVELGSGRQFGSFHPGLLLQDQTC